MLKRNAKLNLTQNTTPNNITLNYITLSRVKLTLKQSYELITLRINFNLILI